MVTVVTCTMLNREADKHISGSVQEPALFYSSNNVSFLCSSGNVCLKIKMYFIHPVGKLNLWLNRFSLRFFCIDQMSWSAVWCELLRVKPQQYSIPAASVRWRFFPSPFQDPAGRWWTAEKSVWFQLKTPLPLSLATCQMHYRTFAIFQNQTACRSLRWVLSVHRNTNILSRQEQEECCLIEYDERCSASENIHSHTLAFL